MKTDFQMLAVTLLLCAPSEFNQLVKDPKSTSVDLTQFMNRGDVAFDGAAVTLAQQQLFPLLDIKLDQRSLGLLTATTTLRMLFDSMGQIIMAKLSALYGGGTIHPTPGQVTSIVGAMKGLDSGN